MGNILHPVRKARLEDERPSLSRNSAQKNVIRMLSWCFSGRRIFQVEFCFRYEALVAQLRAQAEESAQDHKDELEQREAESNLKVKNYG